MAVVAFGVSLLERVVEGFRIAEVSLPREKALKYRAAAAFELELRNATSGCLSPA